MMTEPTQSAQEAYRVRTLHDGVRAGFSAVVDGPDGWPICHCMSAGAAELIAACLNYRLSEQRAAAASAARVEALEALLRRAEIFANNAKSFDRNEDRCVMTAVHLAGDIRQALAGERK
jgi:hypothetical protein